MAQAGLERMDAPLFLGLAARRDRLDHALRASRGRPGRAKATTGLLDAARRSEDA